MTSFLSQMLINWAKRTKPSRIIGGLYSPYLIRWHLVPRNPLLNIYLHHFLRSDDDRALHDHPWVNLSILLDGEYTEHTIEGPRILTSGNWRFRKSGKMAHRIELHASTCWTLFITGPRYREWGFLCQHGWRHWRDFTATHDAGQIGRGCE